MKPDQIEIVESKQFPGEWLVEAIEFGLDGAIECAEFSGPRAEQRAREYAAAVYAHIPLPPT